MKIYNNIDGQARLVENIADGVNTDDAASVGQVNASSYSPVRYSASRSTELTLPLVASDIGTSTTYVTRSQLVQGQYLSGCTQNTSSTNLVNLGTGVYLVVFDFSTYYTASNYNNISTMAVGARITSNVGFADGQDDHYQTYRYFKTNTAYTVIDKIHLSTSRIVNVSTSAVLGFTVYLQVVRGNTGTNISWRVSSSSYNVVKI